MKLFFWAPKSWIRNYSQHTEQHDYSNASVCCIYLNHRTFNICSALQWDSSFEHPKAMSKLSIRLKSCHCRPARGMPYWWDGPIFRQYINLYLPKLTIDLADPYNSVLVFVANSSDLDQTATIAAVWSGSTLFVCLPKLANLKHVADDYNRHHFRSICCMWSSLATIIDPVLASL